MATFVIAEAGVNHGGDLREAEKLIVAAKRSGADAVKFQLFSADKLHRPELKPLEISYANMEGLKIYADRQGIEFMCTPFDPEAVDFLKPLVKRMKVGSGSITDHDLLYSVYLTGLPVILSTGMSTMATVRKALESLHSYVTLLHCTSAYPCPAEDVNLLAMDSLRELGYQVGYSDHTEGISVPIAAVARGAIVIEKHLTLDRNAVGPDHKASIEPVQFNEMVDGIRQVEKAMGDGIKRQMPSETPAIRVWR